MIKIFLTVRNRLAITCKCITALKKFSQIEHKIYVYDNSTNYKEEEHFLYFSQLYKHNLISQVNFTTIDSTFHAFSKAVTCNLFGLQHSQDPEKNNYDFLLFMDNDMIVKPNWDTTLVQAWKDLKNFNLDNIKVVTQFPAGIRYFTNYRQKIAGKNAILGKLGGSGFWTVRPNFFEDVGYLDVKEFIGLDKKHDQIYWNLMDNASKGNSYILGIKDKFCIHTGKIVGSTCATLNKHYGDPNRGNLINFEKEDEFIDNMSFDEFYKYINNDKEMCEEW